MAQAIRFQFKRDPKEDLREVVGDLADLVAPMGAAILVAVWEPPAESMSAGGVLIPGTSTTDAKYQGKVGLVLKTGPIAFKEDNTHRFGDVVPKVGDWVLYSVGDTFPFELGKARCRIVDDVYVKAVLGQPDIAY